ncbi:MAG: signal peptidase II, partial [Chlamydiota bacterium]
MLLGLDGISKFLALLYIPPMRSLSSGYPFGGIGVFSDFFGISFSLNYVTNTGAAYGLFAGHSTLLFAIRTAIILGLIAYLFFSKQDTASKSFLWLVATGAVGNAIDYCLYGHVIDFFHFTFWG